MLDWLGGILRTVFLMLDKVLYGFVGIVYNLLTDIAETSIFTEEIFDAFASKIYALLGIFMLFKVSFSIITYIVNPDDFADKNKGFGKLITNIIVTLTLLITTPWIFNQVMDIQRIILRDNIIGKVFVGVSGNNGLITNDSNPGMVMAYDTLSAFYTIDYATYYPCVGISTTDKFSNDDCKNKAFGGDENFSSYAQTLRYAEATKSVDIYLDSSLAGAKDASGNYTMTYIPVISTACGVVLLLLLIVFCFDVAVRSVKLGFLRMIAPIPIISRIDPKKGKEIFDKWMKTTLSTYLDLFIRLLAIYFAIFVITNVSNMQFVDAVTGLRKEVNPFVVVFIILGALMFAKQLPKLIEDITGMKMSGKFTLNPLKKLGEVPGIGGVAAAGGALAATGGLALGRGAANLIGGGAKLGAGRLFNSSKLAMSGSRTLAGTKAAMGRRWEAGKSEARSRINSSGLMGDEGFKGDTAHKILSKEAEKLRNDYSDGLKQFASINEQWKTGAKMEAQLIDKGLSFSSFNGSNTAAYKTAYKNDKFIKSLMALDQADDKAKRVTKSLETVRAGGETTFNNQRYAATAYDIKDESGKVTEHVYGFDELYSQYDTLTKAKAGLEKVHDTMRKTYAEDAQMQDAIKFKKYNSDRNPAGN